MTYLAIQKLYQCRLLHPHLAQKRPQQIEKNHNCHVTASSAHNSTQNLSITWQEYPEEK